MTRKVGAARAHTNIALIKYWGKADAQLMLPQTSSLSLTLDQFYTETEVVFDDQLSQDTMMLDDRPASASMLTRTQRFMDLVRTQMPVPRFAQIVSHNHVPTAAGLASSASAFAALAGAASQAADLNLSKRDLSRLARRGSGSATRSIYGGFVEWHAGDDQTSFAEPIESAPDWPIRMLVLEFNKQEKAIGSTVGMQRSVDSSPYYDAWKQQVAHDLTTIRPAIQAQDFKKVGQISEDNAMRMHALTLSASPSFTYFNGQSIQAMQAVQSLREQGLNCYYTLDAGPNVKVLCLANQITTIKQKLARTFPDVTMIEAAPGPDILLD